LPDAVACVPTAVVNVLVADEFTPTAVAFVFVADEPDPKAVLKPPVADEVWPTAVLNALAPGALAALPTAVSVLSPPVEVAAQLAPVRLLLPEMHCASAGAFPHTSIAAASNAAPAHDEIRPIVLRKICDIATPGEPTTPKSHASQCIIRFFGSFGHR
jgi:hypothetical protein